MKKNLIELLQKFRIPFSDVQVLTDAVPPMDETKLQLVNKIEIILLLITFNNFYL
jgi:hypothetical protein